MERVSASAYRVPTDLPGGDATLTWDATTLVLVEVTAGGRTGIGWTYGSPATTHVIMGELAPLVTRHDAFDVPGANDAMSRAVRNTGRPGIAAGAHLRRRQRAVGPQGPVARHPVGATARRGAA